MRAQVPTLVWGAEGVSVVSDMPGQLTMHDCKLVTCLSSHLSGYKKKKKKTLFFWMWNTHFNSECLSVLWNIHFFPPQTGCSFGGRFYSLEDTWHPDLGEPFGVMHCVLCHCEPVSSISLPLSVLRISAITGGTPDEFQIKRLCEKVELSPEIWTEANVSASLSFFFFFSPPGSKRVVVAKCLGK